MAGDDELVGFLWGEIVGHLGGLAEVEKEGWVGGLVAL